MELSGFPPPTRGQLSVQEGLRELSPPGLGKFVYDLKLKTMKGKFPSLQGKRLTEAPQPVVFFLLFFLCAHTV
jgi:hypothetical protein